MLSSIAGALDQEFHAGEIIRGVLVLHPQSSSPWQAMTMTVVALANWMKQTMADIGKPTMVNQDLRRTMEKYGELLIQ